MELTKLCGGEYNRSAKRNTSFLLPLEGDGGVNIITSEYLEEVYLSFDSFDTVGGGYKPMAKPAPPLPLTWVPTSSGQAA